MHETQVHRTALLLHNLRLCKLLIELGFWGIIKIAPKAKNQGINSSHRLAPYYSVFLTAEIQ